MGNCLRSSEKLTAEIVPHGGATVYPTVRLHGSPNSILAAYTRFAVLHNAVPLQEPVPAAGPPPRAAARDGGSETVVPVVFHVGPEVASGSRDALLRFIDSKFPDLAEEEEEVAAEGGGGKEEATASLVVRATRLQHKSMTWHLERIVRWVEDLETRGGLRAVDPKMGTWKMEVVKFGRSYSQLLEVMLEHAQMEERVLFPIFDSADRGLSKAAKEEHARDLPIMNGIKEIIKSVEVLDSRSTNYRETLYNLSTRLKSLQGLCKQHFMEEDSELLPTMEAVELSKEQDESALEQCFAVMQGTHGRLLKFLLEGLPPHDAMKYLDLISMCRDRENGIHA
ncbi:hemerythrin/HHE cation-binding motif [Spatholobus suberectus]|nr:hemerythrin/HHE cation-binding motif [Spatholobus suberectus]